MNTRAKGNRTRNKAIEYLKMHGYLVGIVERTLKFAKNKDLFNLFDLVAVKKDRTWFVQVTTSVPHTHTGFKEFAAEYGGNHVNIMQMVWIKYKGWKIYVYRTDKTYTCGLG